MQPLPAAQISGHFPVSQDQRNTSADAFRYQIGPRSGLLQARHYDSGLPFAFTGDEADALAQYGPQVISRINFARGRILPSLAVNCFAWSRRLQGDRITTALSGRLATT